MIKIQKYFSRMPKGKWAGWIRWGKYLLQVKSSKPLYSERNGLQKFYKIGFGYRIRFSKDK